MSGLKMKFGGDSKTNQSTHNTDFTYLENNPSYKPNPTVEEPLENKPDGEGSTGSSSKNNEPDLTGESPTLDKPNDNEPIGSESNNIPEEPKPLENKPDREGSTGSSLNNNEPDLTGQEPTKITDELLLQNLSEKLGRELTSFDELVPSSVEIDPQVKALNDWKEKTNRPIEDFFKFQKDFNEVSDLDVAREFLQIEYPTLTSDEINLELEQFVASEDDLDTDIARKNLNLKKYAIEGRSVLEKMKADLGEPSENTLTPEIKEQLDFAKQVQEQINTNQEQQKSYIEGITQAALDTDNMKLDLSDDLSINFKISDEDKKDIPSFINEMSHWKTEDGSWNHKEVVQDSIKIKHFNDILKLVYEQGLNSGKDEVIKQAKNSTLGNSTSMKGEQSQGQSKAVIEGIDELLKQHQGMSLRFG